MGSHSKTVHLVKDVQAWYSSCPECQKATKNLAPRAPLNPLPVIDIPFSRMAFDIVGPLPRTKRGHKMF